MDFLILIFVFIFGTIIGSFLNVVIYRYNSGTSPLSGRSQCFSCGKTLSWRELIPIFSFLASRGRCAGCGVRISWQYPAVEVLTGVAFIAVFLLGKSTIETVYLLSVFSALIVIATYDIRHQIIPDGFVVFFAIVSIAWFFWMIPGGFREAFRFPYFWTLVAGPMLFAPFWALWFVSGGRWLGLGDGKLAWGMGWFLGATLGASAVMLGFWIGASWALLMIAYQKIAGRVSGRKLSLQSEIPFGPFLVLGTVIVYFTGVNFFDGSINLFTFL